MKIPFAILEALTLLPDDFIGSLTIHKGLHPQDWKLETHSHAKTPAIDLVDLTAFVRRVKKDNG